jgi:hypothetical protein
MSNGIAWLVNRQVPDFKTYGGLLLNTVYGGMNPRAFKTAIYYGDGAKYLNFGTHSTYYQASKEGRMVDGRFVPLSELYPKFRKEELSRCIRIPVDEPPDPALDEILQLLARHPHIYMDTGHVSIEEADRLIDLKEEYGYEKIVVSSAVTKIASIEQIRVMAEKGAFIEFSIAAYTAPQMIPLTHYYVEKEYISIDEGMTEEASGGIRLVAEQMRELGSEHCIMSTDFGSISCMLDLGIPPNDIRTMVKTNPERLMGLEPQKYQTPGATDDDQ